MAWGPFLFLPSKASGYVMLKSTHSSHISIDSTQKRLSTWPIETITYLPILGNSADFWQFNSACSTE